MNKAQAANLAAELEKAEHTYAKVGHHTTNGVERYVVHVTHDEAQPERGPAYTIS